MKRDIYFFYSIDGLRARVTFDTLAAARAFIFEHLKADDWIATQLKGLRGMKRGNIVRRTLKQDGTFGACREFGWR